MSKAECAIVSRLSRMFGDAMPLVASHSCWSVLMREFDGPALA